MDHGKSIKSDAKDSVDLTRQFNMDAAARRQLIAALASREPLGDRGPGGPRRAARSGPR